MHCRVGFGAAFNPSCPSLLMQLLVGSIGSPSASWHLRETSNLKVQSGSLESQDKCG